MGFDPVDYLLAMQQAGKGGGGGGNPNYVETITGTVANPWGNANYNDLVAGIAQQNITVYFSIQQLGFGGYVESNGESLSMSVAVFDLAESWSLTLAGLAQYDESGALLSLVMWRNGNVIDVTSTFSGATSIVTIIHHQLPQGGNDT